MTFANGRLPASVLAPIYGEDGKTVVGHLRKDASAAWNAMCERARELGLPVPVPDGPLSTYRTFAQQEEEKRIWCAQGHCENAATPGNSRHGWGIASDVAPDAKHHQDTINRIGEPYGWSKKWSDAPWEPWHITFKDGVRFKRWTPNYRMGSYGPNVYLLTGRLQHLGYLNRRYMRYGSPVAGAVKMFQKHNHLKVDGVCGSMTWYAIKRQAIAKPRRRK